MTKLRLTPVSEVLQEMLWRLAMQLPAMHEWA